MIINRFKSKPKITKQMKKILLIIPAIVVAASCHNYKADVDKLEKEKAELMAAANYKDSTITAFISEVNDIEANLAAIETKQSNIARTGTGELKGNQTARIKENIAAINELVKENKEKVAALNAKLKSSGVKAAGLEKMIASLNTSIAEKDKQLADLNDQVSNLNVTVERLNTDVTTLTTVKEENIRTIEDQTKRLHTAFYTVGTSKELKEQQVVDREGGFLGIGRTTAMKDDFNNAVFKPIDITQTQTIALDAKDAKIITVHPSDSYTLQHEGKDMVTNLVITDPDKFWKTSKYLVVVVDK
jgi:uncharacterized coiled-coil protein SlyX